MNLKYLVNWIVGLFKKKGHILPPIVSGSPDYQTPTIDNVSQDWQKYLSLPFRTQWGGNGFDEDNCATRAAIEVLEALLNYYLINNLFPENLATFLKEKYCNKEGYVKLSIRYNAKLNNTTTQGASVDTVWNNFNIYGIVPESIYPDPAIPFKWNDYYSDIPTNIMELGKTTTTLFQVNWQTIWNGNWNAPDINILRNVLTTCPIYFASAVGTRDANGVEQWNGDKVYKHARLVYRKDDFQEILDSYAYPGYLRKLSQSFPLACAIKVGINII